MAKQRTLNEIRQSKEYQIAKETVNTQYKNPFEHEEVDKAVDQIVETLQPEIFDAIFEAVNNEMSHNFLFQADNSNQWKQIDVPYSGSFFGGIIQDDSIYFFGMRGNILSTSLVSFYEFYVKGKGKSIVFNQYITPSKLGIMSASVDKDGSLLFYESGGVVHKFSDGTFVRGESALDTVVSTVEYGGSTIIAGLKGIKILK